MTSILIQQCIFPYKRVHPPLEELAFGLFIAALIASSNTFFKPSWVKAEHSRYFTAPISVALVLALSVVTMVTPLDARLLIILLSFRKSDLVPTKMSGTPGA